MGENVNVVNISMPLIEATWLKELEIAQKCKVNAYQKIQLFNECGLLEQQDK